MKFLLIALFVAVATSAPIDEDRGPVEVIVNGIPEGEPLDLSGILDISLHEHQNGVIAASSNLLHPFSASGIAEAAAAAEVQTPVIPQPVVLPAPPAPEVQVPSIPQPVVLPAPPAPEVQVPSIPQPVVLPAPPAPEVQVPSIPQPVVLPAPSAPEVQVPSIPQPVVLPAPPAPEVQVPSVPQPVVLPAPPAPEVQVPSIPQPVVLPAPPAPAVEITPSGEIFNNGVVSVAVNTPQDAGIFSSIQSWVNVILNYFSDGAQVSHQIV